MARISRSTFLPAEGEYLRVDFFAEDFFAVDFLAEDFFAPAAFFALELLDVEERRDVLLFFVLVPRRDAVFFAEEDFFVALARLLDADDFFAVLFLALLDFFFAAFLVAIGILL